VNEGYGLFIDAGYSMSAYKSVSSGKRLDYLKLRKALTDALGCDMDEGYFFNADSKGKCENLHKYLTLPYPKGPGLRVQNYNTVERALRWPPHLGGMPVMHPTEPGVQYTLTQQKSVDVGLIWRMLQSLESRMWDKLVLVAGDADFSEPIKYLVEAKKVNLYLVGTVGSLSSDLRPYARKIFDMGDRDFAERIAMTDDDSHGHRAV